MSLQSVSPAGQVDAGGQLRQKRARRSRKDCVERTFVCKICQKSYLSNAALYTHMKTKHTDSKLLQKQPSPSQKQQQKQNVQSVPAQQEPVPEQNQPKQQTIDINASALQTLRQYMKKYYPQRNKGCTIRLICQGLTPQILQYMQPLLKQGAQLKTQQINKTKLTINQVFGLFLMLMNIRVSSTCINFLIRLFYYLRNALKIQTKRSEYCERQNSYNLPNFFNNIILNYRIPSPGFDQDQIMHNPIIICKVLEYFGNWLYQQKYTDYKVIANYKDDS